MRAGFLAAVLSGPTSPLHFTHAPVMRENASLVACTLYLLALGVCWSRVALGRHFTLDVGVGLAMGLALGKSGYPGVPLHGWVRLTLGSAFSMECIAVAARARWRAAVRGYYVLVGINIIFWITMFFAI